MSNQDQVIEMLMEKANRIHVSVSAIQEAVNVVRVVYDDFSIERLGAEHVANIALLIATAYDKGYGEGRLSYYEERKVV